MYPQHQQRMMWIIICFHQNSAVEHNTERESRSWQIYHCGEELEPKTAPHCSKRTVVFQQRPEDNLQPQV
ncbi:hypothetical protein GN956_G22670 [Arapaima gigas]